MIYETITNFQTKVLHWCVKCFGEKISLDRVERRERFLEEALELVQACDMPEIDVLRLVEYVYNRPVGQRVQEVGGTMVTLAALCNAHGISMEAAGSDEIIRIYNKIDVIREKQKNKPRFSPLPE